MNFKEKKDNYYTKELNELDGVGSFAHLKTFKLDILNNLIYNQKPNKDIFLFSNDNIGIKGEINKDKGRLHNKNRVMLSTEF